MGGIVRLPRWTIAAALATAALQGCAHFPTAPLAAADRSILDERIGIGAELAYTTATKLGTVLAQAGLIDKTKFKALDNDAYTALHSVRQAYQAGNATDYASAVQHVQTAVLKINALVEGHASVTG